MGGPPDSTGVRFSSDRRRLFSDTSGSNQHDAELTAGGARHRSSTDALNASHPTLSDLVADSEPCIIPAAGSTPNNTKQSPCILGAADCGSCKDTPFYHLAPCGHTICVNHYLCIPNSVLKEIYSVEAVCAQCHERVFSGISSSKTSHSDAAFKPQFNRTTSHIKSQTGNPAKTVKFDLPAEAPRRKATLSAQPSPLDALQQSLEETHFGLANSQLGMTSATTTGGSLSHSSASSSTQPFTVEEPSARNPWVSPSAAMFSQESQRRSSEGSSSAALQTSHPQQHFRRDSFPQSKSTPNMTDFSNCPSASFMRGTSIWNTQPSSIAATPRITPSPIAESPEEDVVSQTPGTSAVQKKGLKPQAEPFPSSEIISEINARMPQLSLRHPSVGSGSSLTSSRHNTSPFNTPSTGASRRESYANISPGTIARFSGGAEQSVTPTPFDRGHAEKRRLVDLIKSGILTPDEDHTAQPAVPRQRDQSANNSAQFVPTFSDLAYHVSTSESGQFFAYVQKNGGQLSLSDAFTLIPFVEKARIAKQKNGGVIKISNIPYGTTKPEIVAFVGRNARLVQQPQGSPWFAIHIIMERSTAKTMDCYVEFETQKDADHAVDRFKRQCGSHRHPRIGDRHVDVTESSQAALMKELFPRAKCVLWEGQDPRPYETTEPHNSGFKGFTTGEEMVMTIKHAETPQRSPFSHKCYQRTYESLISLLYKYPWWSVENYTLGERDRIHHTTIALIKALQSHRFRHNPTNPQQLTPQLYQELVFAGLNCPGFSESQKCAILKVAYNPFDGASGRETWWGMSNFAPKWVFQTIGRKEGVGEDMLHYFVKLLHDASTSADYLSLAEHRSALLAVQNGKASPFGVCEPKFENDADHTTMADAAHMEWTTIESFLRRVLPASRRSSVSPPVAGLITQH